MCKDNEREREGKKGKRGVKKEGGRKERKKRACPENWGGGEHGGVGIVNPVETMLLFI